MLRHLHDHAPRTARPSAERADPPPIVIRCSDLAPLQAAALRGLLHSPRAAGALLDELRRATVRPDDDVPANVAGLGSLVTFVDRSAEAYAPKEVQLVAPQAPGSDARRVSVLSMLGAGLIGLRAGQTIDWPDRRGGSSRLSILAVRASRLDGPAPEGRRTAVGWRGAGERDA